jgi:hypothetical protein
MNDIRNFVALAVLAVSTALISSASPTAAQSERQSYYPPPPPAPCCRPALKPINTNATWAVKGPTGAAHGAVALNPNPAWHAPFPGSQWIGSDANSAGSAAASGDYVYTMHFCLCALPPRVSPKQFPATLYLSSYADNSFHAYLNNNLIGQDVLVNGFTVPTIISGASPTFFQAGDNELKYVVNNISDATGLDVSGWISGYFQELPPGAKCPHYPGIPPHDSPN